MPNVNSLYVPSARKRESPKLALMGMLRFGGELAGGVSSVMPLTPDGSVSSVTILFVRNARKHPKR